MLKQRTLLSSFAVISASFGTAAAPGGTIKVLESEFGGGELAYAEGKIAKVRCEFNRKFKKDGTPGEMRGRMMLGGTIPVAVSPPPIGGGNIEGVNPNGTARPDREKIKPPKPTVFSLVTERLTTFGMDGTVVFGSAPANYSVKEDKKERVTKLGAVQIMAIDNLDLPDTIGMIFTPSDALAMVTWEGPLTGGRVNIKVLERTLPPPKLNGDRN